MRRLPATSAGRVAVVVILLFVICAPPTSFFHPEMADAANTLIATNYSLSASQSGPVYLSNRINFFNPTMQYPMTFTVDILTLAFRHTTLPFTVTISNSEFGNPFATPTITKQSGGNMDIIGDTTGNLVSSSYGALTLTVSDNVFHHSMLTLVGFYFPYGSTITFANNTFVMPSEFTATLYQMRIRFMRLWVGSTVSVTNNTFTMTDTAVSLRAENRAPLLIEGSFDVRTGNSLSISDNNISVSCLIMCQCIRFNALNTRISVNGGTFRIFSNNLTLDTPSSLADSSVYKGAYAVANFHVSQGSSVTVNGTTGIYSVDSNRMSISGPASTSSYSTVAMGPHQVSYRVEVSTSTGADHVALMGGRILVNYNLFMLDRASDGHAIQLLGYCQNVGGVVSFSGNTISSVFANVTIGHSTSGGSIKKLTAAIYIGNVYGYTEEGGILSIDNNTFTGTISNKIAIYVTLVGMSLARPVYAFTQSTLSVSGNSIKRVSISSVVIDAVTVILLGLTVGFEDGGRMLVNRNKIHLLEVDSAVLIFGIANLKLSTVRGIDVDARYVRLSSSAAGETITSSTSVHRSPLSSTSSIFSSTNQLLFQNGSPTSAILCNNNRVQIDGGNVRSGISLRFTTVIIEGGSTKSVVIAMVNNTVDITSDMTVQSLSEVNTFSAEMRGILMRAQDTLDLSVAPGSIVVVSDNRVSCNLKERAVSTNNPPTMTYAISLASRIFNLAACRAILIRNVVVIDSTRQTSGMTLLSDVYSSDSVFALGLGGAVDMWSNHITIRPCSTPGVCSVTSGTYGMYVGFQYWTISGGSTLTIDSNTVYVQGHNDALSAPRFYGIVLERNRGYQPGPNRHAFETEAADDPSSASTLSGSTFRVVSNTVVVNAYFPYSSMVALRVNLDPIALGDSRLLVLSNVLTSRTIGSVVITGTTPRVYSTIALDVSKLTATLSGTSVILIADNQGSANGEGQETYFIYRGKDVVNGGVSGTLTATGCPNGVDATARRLQSPLSYSFKPTILTAFTREAEISTVRPCAGLYVIANQGAASTTTTSNIVSVQGISLKGDVHLANGAAYHVSMNNLQVSTGAATGSTGISIGEDPILGSVIGTNSGALFYNNSIFQSSVSETQFYVALFPDATLPAKIEAFGNFTISGFMLNGAPSTTALFDTNINKTSPDSYFNLGCNYVSGVVKAYYAEIDMPQIGLVDFEACPGTPPNTTTTTTTPSTTTNATTTSVTTTPNTTSTTTMPATTTNTTTTTTSPPTTSSTTTTTTTTTTPTTTTTAASTGTTTSSTTTTVPSSTLLPPLSPSDICHLSQADRLQQLKDLLPLNKSFYAPPNLGTITFLASEIKAGITNWKFTVYSQSTYHRTTTTTATGTSTTSSLVKNETAELTFITPVSIQNMSILRDRAESVSIGSNAYGFSGKEVPNPTISGSITRAAIYSPGPLEVVVSSTTTRNTDSTVYKEEIVYRYTLLEITLSISAVANFVIDIDETVPIGVLWDDVISGARTVGGAHSGVPDTPISENCAGLKGQTTELLYLRIGADQATLNLGQMAAQYSSAVFTGGLGIMGAFAGYSAAAADLQMTGLLGFMSCADPFTHRGLLNYRILSPFALDESYVGVLSGNFIFAMVLLAIQLLLLAFHKLHKKVSRLLELQAKVHFPAFTYAAIVVFYTGSMYSAGKLVTPAPYYETSTRIPDSERVESMSNLLTSSSDSQTVYTPSSGTIAVVVIVCIFAAVFPVFLSLWAALRIARAFQRYEARDWLAKEEDATSGPIDGCLKSTFMSRFVMPVGGIYSPLTRVAFGYTVSAIRAKQHFWASYMTWGGSVAFVAGLVSPQTIGGCQAYFSVISLIYFIFTLALAFIRPMRSHADNALEVASKLLVSLVYACAAIAVPGTSFASVQASYGITALIVLLAFVLILRIVVYLTMWYYDYRMEKDQVPMTVEWSHELNSKGLAKLFMVDAGDTELQQISSNRDTTQESTTGGSAATAAPDSGGTSPTSASSKPLSLLKGGRQPRQQVASFNYEDDDEDDLALPMQDMYGVEDGDDGDYFGRDADPTTTTSNSRQQKKYHHYSGNKDLLPSRRGGRAVVKVGQSDNLFDDEDDVLGPPVSGVYQPPHSDDDDLVDL